MPFTPQHPLVWAEIPVRDIDAAQAFYRKITGGTLMRSDDGPNPMVMFKSSDNANGIGLHLYPGEPATDGNGPTLHLAAQGTCEEIMERVTSAGGEVLHEPISIPAGRFFYAKDPDGNSIGLFEKS